MSFRLPCPSCRAPQALTEAYLGRQVRCQKCGTAFRVERPTIPLHSEERSADSSDGLVRSDRPVRPAPGGAGAGLMIAVVAGVLLLAGVGAAYLFLTGRPMAGAGQPATIQRPTPAVETHEIRRPVTIPPALVLPHGFNFPQPRPDAELELPPGSGAVLAFAFSTDGKTLTAATDAEVAVWFGLNEKVKIVDPKLGVVRGETRAIELKARSPGRSGADGLVAATISADGRRVAFARNGGALFYFDQAAPRDAVVVRPDDWGGDGQEKLAFSPDGSRIVTGHTDGHIRMWHAGERKLVGEWKRSQVPIYGVAFAPDGRSLVCADTAIGVYDGETLKQVGEIRGRLTKMFSALAFSPDGKYLAGAQGTDVRFWHVTRGRPDLPDTRGYQHTARVVSVAVSPARRLIAVADDAGGVVVWDTLAEAYRLTIPSEASGVQPNVSVAFSPTDGRLAVARGGSIRLYAVGVPKN